MPDSSGAFTMGEREILQVAVARIEEQQKNVAEKLSDLAELITDTNRRVSVIEEFKWKIVGISMAVGIMSSGLVLAVKFVLSKL